MSSLKSQDWWKRIPKTGGPRGEVQLGGRGGYTIQDNALAGVVESKLVARVEPRT